MKEEAKSRGTAVSKKRSSNDYTPNTGLRERNARTEGETGEETGEDRDSRQGYVTDGILAKRGQGTLHLGPEISDTGLEQAVLSHEADVLHAIGTLSARLDQFVNERKKLISDWNTIRNLALTGYAPSVARNLAPIMDR